MKDASDNFGFSGWQLQYYRGGGASGVLNGIHSSESHATGPCDGMPIHASNPA